MQTTDTLRKPVSFAAVLKKMHGEARTGKLSVESPDSALELGIIDGKVVSIHQKMGDGWLFGEYLQFSGTISEKKLLKALKDSRNRNTTPEILLVERRLISKDVAIRISELVLREMLLPLFSKVGIVVRFTPDEPWSDPLLPVVSIPYLIREGARRAAEWPALRHRIPSLDLVYAKDGAKARELFSGDRGGFDEDTEDPSGPALGADERIVLHFIDGRMNVRQMSRTANLDTFTTCRALVNLESNHLVRVVGESSRNVARDPTVLPFLMKMVVYLGIVAALAVLWHFRPGPLSLLNSSEIPGRELMNQVARARFSEAARDAAEENLLRRGRLPSGLDELEGFTNDDKIKLGELGVMVIPDEEIKTRGGD